MQSTAALAAGISTEKASLLNGVARPSTALDPNTLKPFVDALPIPPVMKSSEWKPDPQDPARKIPYYRVSIEQVQQKVHRDLPSTTMWGFNGSSPGPTFETRGGQGILVEWSNQLPVRHLLPIDHTIHGAENDKPDVRCVVHLHGGRTPSASDGYPEDWVPPGRSRIYHYPNRQDAALLFYHDHTMGINRLNIYAGLQGLYVIRDEIEDQLKLPSGKYEVPLLLCDRLLKTDGQLQYPVSDNPKSPWVPEVYGDIMLVNGKLAPYLDVEPRRYRFRLMNGSNARFFRISFGEALEMEQIGTDQGLLGAALKLHRVLLAPAERADVIFDFSAHAGQTLLLKSDSFDLMQFRVAAVAAPLPKNHNSLPTVLRSVQRIPEEQAVKVRRLSLDETTDMVQQSMGMTLNNTPWHMPVTEKPVLNTTEIWELVNTTEDTHPIHLHLVQFQLLDRRTFDVFQFQDRGTMRYVGPAIPAAGEETGWKDTVRCESGHVTRIIVPFKGYPGRYVWHCHILEHEDNEMMRPYEIVEA